MALNDLELWSLLHNDGDLWHRIEVEGIKAALGVLGEPVGTANHAARLVWANALLNDPTAWTLANRIRLLSNATLYANGNASTDAQVATAIAGLLATIV
jgi:hypothetical protein